MLLLRIGRRRTVWEHGSIDEIIKTEFSSRGQLELDASVYSIDPSQLVQTVAEHSAGSHCDPPRGFDNIDLESDRPVIQTPGETGFEFTTAAHRELRFSSEADLRHFLVHTILPDIDKRRYVATKQEVKRYVQARLASGDSEWTRFLAGNPKWI